MPVFCRSATRLVTVPSIVLFVLVCVAAAAACAGTYDEEIARLAARPDVQRAFALIERNEPASNRELVELTEIPAPPFGEAQRAGRYLDMLVDAGLGEVERDAEGNVLGRWRGTGRGHTVAVVAHLDTVFPAGTALDVRVASDRFLAPGVADNSRGLVTMLSMVRALVGARIETDGDILFVASVGEEGIGDLRGVKYLFRDGGPRIDELIAIDGGNDARVLNRAIGSHRFRATFRGPGGHSWGAFGLANPAEALSSAIHYFVTEAGDAVRAGPRTSFNVGRIGGGTSVNAIPYEAWAEIDIRSEDPGRLELVDAVLRRAVERALAEHNQSRRRGEVLTVDVETIGNRPSGLVSPDTPLIQRAMAATRYFGIEPVLGAGSTDANVPIALGVPATTISRGGRSGGAHSPNEWWSAENSARGVQKALLITLASAGVSAAD
jgi:acetylornithine deacetylase/succinyl-diaminopimelate desuccinylase-like protein